MIKDIRVFFLYREINKSVGGAKSNYHVGIRNPKYILKLIVNQFRLLIPKYTINFITKEWHFPKGFKTYYGMFFLRI